MSGGEGWGKYYRAAASYANPPDSTREPGARRKKLAGYLQAANELRQSYTAGYTNRQSELNNGEWPDTATVRSNDEELVLFPSYARLLTPGRRRRDRLRDHLQPTEQGRSTSPSIQEEWDVDEEEQDAVIEVDVRGWLYAPHSGAMSRKNRYALWVARQLCGLPAQIPGGADNPTAEEVEDAKQAASEIAGGRPPQVARAATGLDGSSPSRRTSWRPEQQQMTPAEINAAHAAFNERCAPFMHRPITNTPVTIFFYNEEASQSRSIITADTGHFSVRAALPFIPTHVRVLASETLSATEEINIHAPDGVSVISDIDDTVKHSAISLGTREVFRNTFTAPLSSLFVPGVAEWYSALYSAPYNVSFHYISNSPWQLYPVLRSFFQQSGLPPGSFHLKQYSGMLQGIFEPAAERKKGTVERVITDFPDRKWLLVGDSGEADLEVYTEIAERYPENVLAVCIRDVTTTQVASSTRFFDSSEKLAQEREGRPTASTTSSYSIRPPPTAGPSRNGSNGPPPPLPKRPQLEQDLIDLSDDSPALTRQTSISSVSSAATGRSRTAATPPPPPPPRKPAGLRSPLVPSKPESLKSSPSKPELRSDNPPPPPPPRRTATIGGTVPEDSAPLPPPPIRERTTTTYSNAASTDPAVSKKEELWRRRWERAGYVLNRKGVKLFSWRTGSDVQDETLALVADELGIKEGRSGRRAGEPNGKGSGWQKDA